MSKNNDKKQPFILFCEERRQTYPSLYAGKSLTDMVPLCSALWSKLEFHVKQHYKDMANDLNSNGYFGQRGSASDIECEGTLKGVNVQGKFDSFGRSLMAVKEKEKAEELEEKMMLKDIEERVVFAKEANHLQLSRIHIMFITAWTKTAPITEYDGPNEPGIEGDVIPAEIGLIEMNLRDGLTSRCYQLVHPGPLPLGYKGDMMARSEKTHQIWLDNPCLSEDYDTIMESIRTMVSVKADRDHYAGFDCNALNEFEIMNVDESHVPHSLISAKNYQLLPIYVMPEHRKTCRKALNWLKRKANVEYSFCLYNLPQLLVHLVKYAPLALDADSDLTSSMAEAHLQRDVFLYVPGVACSYHDKRQNYQCAGGAASRLGYIVCDFACKLYNINVMEGYHLPSGVMIRGNNALDSDSFLTGGVNGSSQTDCITDSSWDNNSDAISIPNDNKTNKTFNTTFMSHASSVENPYNDLMADAQVSGLGFAGKSRHAVIIDSQEVTEHILAPMFGKTGGLSCKRNVSTENDSEYQSFITSPKINSTLNSVSDGKGRKNSSNEAKDDNTYSFRMLHELTLKSDFRVHPPPCHKQVVASKVDKKTNIFENKELGPPIAKSAYHAEKIKKMEARVKR